MELEKRKARVVNMEDDGMYVDVSYITGKGEEAIGMYKRFGWVKAPASYLELIKAETLAKPQRARKRTKSAQPLQQPQDQEQDRDGDNDLPYGFRHGDERDD
jgi:hypothetical protein